MAFEKVDGTEEAEAGMRKLGLFQQLHNELRKDFVSLAMITDKKVISGEPSSELIRACLKELFSLIEADLFHLNVINPYDGYKDKDGIVSKFKKTYILHCKKHDKDAIYTDFEKIRFNKFIELKQKRDELMHPKTMQSIHTDKQLFIEVYEFATAYIGFVDTIMQGVGYKIEIKAEDLFSSFSLFGRI